MRAILVALVVALATTSCNSFNTGACKKLTIKICDECDLSDSQELTCDCLQDNEIDGDDVDDYFGGDEDSALRWCWSVQESVAPTYQTHDAVAYCRQNLSYLKEWGDDACEDWGYESSHNYDSGE